LAKIEKYCAIVGLTISIALLPIDRFPYLHRTPKGLALISMALLLFAAISSVYRSSRGKKWLGLRSYKLMVTALTTPVIIYALGTTYALNKNFALQATIDLLGAILRGLLCAVIINENRWLWPYVKRVIYIVTAVITMYAFFQFFLDVFGASTSITDLRGCCTSNSTYVFPRVHSVSIEPLYLAHFFLLPLWLLTYDLVHKKQKSNQKYLYVLFISTATIFILTSARSAFAGMLFSSVFFALSLRSQRESRKKIKLWIKPWLISVLFAFLLIMMSGLVARSINKTALYGADSGGGGSVKLFTTHAVSVADDSALTRYGTWPEAFSLASKEPVLGFGTYNSRIALNRGQYNKGVKVTDLQPFNNDYLGIIVDFGLLSLVGFIPLLLLLVDGFKKLYKSSWLGNLSPFGLSLMAMLVQALFFHSILLSRTWFVIAFFGLSSVDAAYYARKRYNW